MGAWIGGFGGARNREHDAYHVEELAKLGALIEHAREPSIELVAHEAQQVEREGCGHIIESDAECDRREDDSSVSDEVGNVGVHVGVALEEAGFGPGGARAGPARGHRA